MITKEEEEFSWDFIGATRDRENYLKIRKIIASFEKYCQPPSRRELMSGVLFQKTLGTISYRVSYDKDQTLDVDTYEKTNSGKVYEKCLSFGPNSNEIEILDLYIGFIGDQ